MEISDYIHPDAIFFIDADTRDEVLRVMIEQLFEAGRISDPEAFYQAVSEREKVVSTGIGMGVAIPHAKLPDYGNFFVAVGILQKGVDWNALDLTPVRLVFLLGGPENKQTEYLQILSVLTAAIKDETHRKKMLTLESKEDIIRLFNT